MLQFDDDVEGTGMGEGEGKKDVTDQIEDEEQLLGLKGDEPDKDQAEEAKELGRSSRQSGSVLFRRRVGCRVCILLAYSSSLPVVFDTDGGSA